MRSVYNSKGQFIVKKEITVTGENVESAVQNAIEALGASSLDDITYEVLELESKGFLGIGRRPAKIKASIEIPDNTPKKRSEVRAKQQAEIDAAVSAAKQQRNSAKEKAPEKQQKNTQKKQKVAAHVVDEEYPESYSRLVEYLEKFFSQDIAIKRGKSGGGKIIIDFSSDADIEKFIKKFSKQK